VLSVSIYVETLSVGGVVLFSLIGTFTGRVRGIQDVGRDLVVDRTGILCYKGDVIV